MRKSVCIFAISVLFGASACAEEDKTTKTPEKPQQPVSERVVDLKQKNTTQKSMKQDKVEPGLVDDERVQQAKQALAEKIDIDMSEIEVVMAERVMWPDSSMGCPQPGMQYLQMLTKGIKVKLKAEGQVYDFHGGENGIGYCKNPST